MEKDLATSYRHCARVTGIVCACALATDAPFYWRKTGKLQADWVCCGPGASSKTAEQGRVGGVRAVDGAPAQV